MNERNGIPDTDLHSSEGVLRYAELPSQQGGRPRDKALVSGLGKGYAPLRAPVRRRIDEITEERIDTCNEVLQSLFVCGLVSLLFLAGIVGLLVWLIFMLPV